MYFTKTADPPVSVNAPKHYLILIPRLLSSFMMHLTVEQDIRNGLLLMKYAVNHPFLFKASIHQADHGQGEKTRTTAMTRRTTFAFLLGFFQAMVSIIVESLVIYYLSSLDELMTIIIKFVSLAKITNFDDMYAKSLYEHTIKAVKGKELRITFHRRDIFEE